MNRITLIIICILTTSCAQKKKPEIISDVMFITHIKDNGVKVFSYSATLNQKKKTANTNDRGFGNKGTGGRGGAAAGGRGDRGGRGGSNDRSKNDSSHEISEKLKSRVYQNLNESLKAGFCREGYIETESFFDKKYIQIKGTCNERASNLDRKTYPNK